MLRPDGVSALLAIKILHTAVWAFLVGCILALPVAALAGRYDAVAVLTFVVLFECSVLAVNRGRCPLTDLAGRYTDDRAHNFDIFLPPWLAQHNKRIFGTLFVCGELIALWSWFR